MKLVLTMMESKVGCTVLGKLEGTEGICTAKTCVHSTLLHTLSLPLALANSPRHCLERVR